MFTKNIQILEAVIAPNYFSRENFIQKLDEKELEDKEFEELLLSKEKEGAQTKAQAQESLSKKNLNYRVVLEQEKKLAVELEKKMLNKNKELTKLIREKDTLETYIKKMQNSVDKKQSSKENMLDFNTKTESGSGESREKESKLTIKMLGGCPTVTMQDSTTGNKNAISNQQEMMRFLNKIYRENLSLKNLQHQVYALSRTYEDIKNNLSESISGFKEISDKNNLLGDDVKTSVNGQLTEFKSEIERSLEEKQNEYNNNMDKKDTDYKALSEQYLSSLKELEQLRIERINSQKLNLELNLRLEVLQNKINEYERKGQ